LHHIWKEGICRYVQQPGSEPEKIYSSLKDLKINAKNCIEAEPEFENVEGDDFFNGICD